MVHSVRYNTMAMRCRRLFFMRGFRHPAKSDHVHGMIAGFCAKG